MIKNKNVVVTYGTFDLLHYGHILFLDRARKLGDCLYVGLSTNEFTLLKGKSVFMDYSKRKSCLEALKSVDYVFLESSWEQKEHDLARFSASKFVIGDDWRGKFDHLSHLCDVIYLSRTPSISTSLIKNAIIQGRLESSGTLSGPSTPQ